MPVGDPEQARTLEVPRERWGPFVRTVSEQTRDRPVRVEVLDPALGDQPLSSTAPFRSLEWVERGSAKDTLELELGLDASFDHRVLKPRRLFVRLSAGGEVEAIDIEDEQRTRTLIAFDRPLAMLPQGQRLRRRAPIRDLMTPLPQTLERGRSIEQADALMQQLGIRHLPIVDRGKLVGILSDRDLYLLKAIRGIDPADVMVDEVMTPDPFRVQAHTALEEVAATMAQLKYGSAVIVEGEQVIGIFTTTDALRALTRDWA